MSTRYEIRIAATGARAAKAAFRAVREGATRGGQSLRAFNKSMKSGAGSASLLSGKLKGLVSAYAAVASFKGLKDAAVAAQGLSVGFESIMGSASGAASELKFLRGVSEDLRLDFYATADSYKGILASGKETGLRMEDIRNVFIGVSEAGSALKLSNEQVQGSLYATSQMMSKGRISAEELRQQLGERLPGAFPLAAKAMGVTTAELDKLLSTGKVAAEDFIPKFAAALREKFGKSARDAANDTSNMQAAINDFSTAWMDLKVAMAESGFIEESTAIIRDLANLFKDPAFQKNIKAVASAVFGLVGAISKFMLEHIKAVTVIAGAAGLIWAFKRLKKIIISTSAALKAFTGIGLAGWATKAVAGMKALGVAAAATAGKLVAGFKAIAAVIAGSTVAMGGLVAAVIAGVAAIVYDLKLLYEGWKNNREAMQRVYEYTGQLKDKYAEFKDIKIPGDITAMAQEDLKRLHEDLLKSRAYYIALKVELEAKAKERNIFGHMTSDAKKAHEELQVVNARLTEIRGGISRIENMSGFERPKQEIMATNEQLEQFKKTAKDAYESAEADAKKYADKIADLNNSIADRDLSLQDKIRDLRRENMTEERAAADVRRQALEKEKAAEEALAKFKQSNSERDLELLKKFASDAESAWDQYANQGEQATETSIDGLTRINDLLDEADQTQIDTFSKMRDDAQQAMTDIEAMVKRINESTQFEFPIKLKDLESARSRINDLVRDETKHITIKVTEAHGHGGRVGMAAGGRFPGNSKVDSIPVLARPGEGFVRNEALAVWDRKFGRGFFEGINAPWSNAGQAIIRALSGKISLPAMPKSAPRLAYATGGRVNSPLGDMRDMGSINFNLGGDTVKMMGQVTDIARLKQFIARENARRSNG